MAGISENIENLATAYRTKVDALTDTFEQAKALVALDAWKSAEYAYADQVAVTAESYSSTGRSVNKRSLEASRTARDSAIADLEGILGTGGAGVTYIDMGGCL